MGAASWMAVSKSRTNSDGSNNYAAIMLDTRGRPPLPPCCCRALCRALPKGVGILDEQNLITLFAVDDLVHKTS